MTEPEQRHRILFLDFDGVMQPDYEASHARARAWSDLRDDAYRRFHWPEDIHLGSDDIAAVIFDWTDEAVASVRRIVETCEASIVISSSWRGYDSDEELRSLLELRGLSEHFEGAIGRDFSRSRERLIRECVVQRPVRVDNFVALDDAQLRGLGRYFVHVTKGSLTAANADRAIAVLLDEK